MDKENSCPVPEGTLVIIGGREEKTNDTGEKENPDSYIPKEVLKTFVSLIDKKDPVVEVITTGTGLPEEYFTDYEKVFHELGILQLNHLNHTNRAEALHQSLIERVDAADAFFFTGGDQLLLTSFYGGSPFLTRLKERYILDKIIIGGTSAGAMAMSTPMIYAGASDVQNLAGEIKVTTGLEFLKDVCIDTHFVNRGRFIRLAQVIATNPTCLGVGIEENTALVVREGDKVEIIGSGIVTVIEGFDITEANTKDFGSKEPISIRDLRVHLLSRRDRYEIRKINPSHK